MRSASRHRLEWYPLCCGGRTKKDMIIWPGVNVRGAARVLRRPIALQTFDVGRVIHDGREIFLVCLGTAALRAPPWAFCSAQEHSTRSHRTPDHYTTPQYFRLTLTALRVALQINPSMANSTSGFLCIFPRQAYNCQRKDTTRRFPRRQSSYRPVVHHNRTPMAWKERTSTRFPLALGLVPSPACAFLIRLFSQCFRVAHMAASGQKSYIPYCSRKGKQLDRQTLELDGLVSSRPLVAPQYRHSQPEQRICAVVSTDRAVPNSRAIFPLSRMAQARWRPG